MVNLSLLIKNRKDVLGRNERQLVYIRENNKRRSVKIADDKTLAKKILQQNNIPVPEKIAVIKSKEDLEHFNFDKLPKSFVIKPVKGVRGSGVDIFYNRDKNGKWIRADKTKASLDDIKGLCIDIIDGKYSLFNQPDVVLIEERVKAHKDFKYFTYKGTPDVRVIVYNKIPIMSYIRLPTKESNGKANLDQGAIGAGIDMAVGKTTDAIIGKGTPIEYIPETGVRVSGLKIPYWDLILKYAVEASKVTGLGFGAIDFLIDREKGPLIVELNARPGLSIQLSNDDGLRWRLKKASGIKVKTVEQGVRLGKDLFGGEIEEEIETISGKRMIGITE
ncbi:MAG: sugar-transfer associated ATP-grasp domain-containing protein, partial [Candidatus Dojkabacteria bacterium]